MKTVEKKGWTARDSRSEVAVLYLQEPLKNISKNEVWFTQQGFYSPNYPGHLEIKEINLNPGECKPVTITINIED